MSAWVRFVNQTKYPSVYIHTDEISVPLLLFKGDVSRYVFSSEGTISVKLFDKNEKYIKDVLCSVMPSKLNTVVLS